MLISVYSQYSNYLLIGMKLVFFYYMMLYNRFDQLNHLTQPMTSSEGLALPKEAQNATF